MLARMWRRLRRDTSGMLGLGLVAALLLFALLAPMLLGGDPNTSHFGLERAASGGPPPPSASHWLGCDPLYRDLLLRLAHGGRLSLAIAAGATLLALASGTVLGVLAGYSAGGRFRLLDSGLMRLVDVALAFPYLLLITAIGVAIDRAEPLAVVLILGFTSWGGVARLARSKILQLRQRGYVTAARALGADPWHVAKRHLLPGLAPMLLVIGSHAVAQMILAEAVLGYLTVGIEPPQATWGRMLHEAEHYLGVVPHLVAVPAVAIMLSVIGFSRLGDGLRDALPDGERKQIDHLGSGSTRILADVVVIALAVGALLIAEPEPLRAPTAATAATAGSETATAQRGGTLRLATYASIHGLDPALAYDEASRLILEQVYARLLTWNADGALQPDLAESFAPLEDGKGYRFTLRDKLSFQDGQPLHAADVKRSLERTLHPKTPSPVASLYQAIDGFEAFRSGAAEELSGIVALDPRRLEIHLRQPDATFPALLTLAFAAPVCRDAGAFADTKAQLPPCGAGPFRLAAFDRGERIRLERFANYHRKGRPYLDAVEWTLTMPARTQRYRFEKGALDIIGELSGIDATRFDADPRWAELREWRFKPAVQGVFLNTEVAPFDNRHIRRAVSFALDPSVLPKVRASVAATDRLVPASVPRPAAPTRVRRYDPAAALQEMAAAGYAYDPVTSSGGYPESIDYLTVPDTFEQAAAEVFQQQLARVGLRIRLRLVSWASWLSQISKRGTVPMGWRGWSADYPDPSNFFEPLFTTGAIQAEGSQNVSFFSHAKLDALVAQAHVADDPQLRWTLYGEAESIVHEEAPFVPLYVHRSLLIRQPRVRGLTLNPITALPLADVWLATGSTP